MGCTRLCIVGIGRPSAAAQPMSRGEQVRIRGSAAAQPTRDRAPSKDREAAQSIGCIGNSGVRGTGQRRRDKGEARGVGMHHAGRVEQST